MSEPEKPSEERDEMDMSIVIRCWDDDRVFRCVESVDEDVEVIVSTSSNPEFEEKLAAGGLTYCLAPRGNLSGVSNIGFASTKHDKVLITDSDTVFECGCIRRMHDALDEYGVVRAKLKFRHDAGVPFSRVVAEARDFVNSMPLVYTPGIAVRKDILPEIGGFLFNDPVPFAVDADLNYRIRSARIPVQYLDDAVIYHDPEGPKHDARAAFRIGRGCMISAVHLSNHSRFGHRRPWVIARELKGVKPQHLRTMLRTKGVSTLSYQLLWDLLFYSGMIRESLVGKLGRED